MTSTSTIVTSEQHLYQTIVQFDKTIVLPRNLATGTIHDYLFCNCPLVGIIFEVLRIAFLKELNEVIDLIFNGWGHPSGMPYLLSPGI